jgi:hypothetical protein
VIEEIDEIEVKEVLHQFQVKEDYLLLNENLIDFHQVH